MQWTRSMDKLSDVFRLSNLVWFWGFEFSLGARESFHSWIAVDVLSFGLEQGKAPQLDTAQLGIVTAHVHNSH